MNHQTFLDSLATAGFAGLFNEMGWDRPSARGEIELAVDEQRLVIREVAVKCGFHAYACEVAELPQHAQRRKIDTRLRKYGNDYILVCIQSGVSMRHQWIVPVKTVEKRELVAVDYASADQADFLFEKVRDISFGLTQIVTIVDVCNAVHAAFRVNAAKITKEFYRTFQQEHDLFAGFIAGIPKTALKERKWYASVMLNRLMFCYFIQKKGFLDLDDDYLGAKFRLVTTGQLNLSATPAAAGGKFFSFYRTFLRALFSDGLNSPRHSPDFEKIFGRIPYLNGGLFEPHEIERKYAELDISDDAFASLFSFFDKWHWHLDTNLTASGRDINPDVLGYIFEQYINDRAEMGAYYTKEDITEYIGKNCMLPFLFDAVARTGSDRHFRPDGFVWQLVKTSGDAYIHDAVKKGVDLPLPPEIERGVAVTSNPVGPSLRERRAAWNQPADAAYALPTEIWRETVARRQRCHELRRKIAAGEITQINDFITWNLDIRRFAEDVLEKTDDPRLVRHFYDALRGLTVLDPTCGSGAFLFAALNILEPLYEACIARMQEFHEANGKLFKDELAEIEDKYRSNIQHYIYKSIILRNLYGVDLMREATEIARLRLFLKMVAVVDVDRRAENLGLDPLPDIDFNIRCGNTLVGFASPEDVKKALVPEGQLGIFDDVYQQIDAKALEVATVNSRFKALQLDDNMGSPAFHEAKRELKAKLAELNADLDAALARTHYSIDTKTLAGNKAFQKWRESHQPFHWYSEFYDIIVERGGFDVIIGNPPYVAASSISYSFPRKDELPDLYGHVILRLLGLIRDNSRYGMIVPVSIAFGGDFRALRKALLTKQFTWFSSFDRIPGALFDGVRQRCTICLGMPSGETLSHVTPMVRWRTETRDFLFSLLEYSLAPAIDLAEFGIPKYSMGFETLFHRLASGPQDRSPARFLLGTARSEQAVMFSSVAANFISVSLQSPPCLDAESLANVPSTKSNRCPMASEDAAKVALAALAGEFYFWYWLTRGDGFDVTNWIIADFLAALGAVTQTGFDLLARLGGLLDAHGNEALVFKKNAGKFVGNYNYRGLSRLTRRSDLVVLAELGFGRETALMLFDYIQRVLSVNVFAGEKGIPADLKAKFSVLSEMPADEPAILADADSFIRDLYGFTEEELDFIVNYDIKYRMGDELAADE